MAEELLKEVGLEIPSLLPLQPPPQNEEQVIPYIQALHNYLADDRSKVARAINIANYFRLFAGTTAQMASFVPQDTKHTFTDEETLLMSIDSSVKSGSPAWEPIMAGTVLWSDYTHDPTGFAVPEAGVSGAATIGISGSNFFIEPYDTEFKMLYKGRIITKTAQETLDLTPCNAEGNWFIYYQYDSDTDTASLVLDDAVVFEDVIRDNIFVCELYHDGTSIQFGVRETHGTMPWQIHLLWHFDRGTAWRSGLGLTNMVVDGDGNTDSHAEVDAAAGVIADEDIPHSLAAMTGNWDTLYRENGAWKFGNTSSNSPVVLDTGVPQYNDVSTPGSEALAPVTNQRYYLIHILATGIEFDGSGNAVSGHVAVLGQNEYISIADARVGATEEVNTLETSGLPMPEFVFNATIIAQRKGSNAYNTAFRSTDEGDDYVSWLGTNITPGSPPSSHPNMTNRDLPNQHPATAISADVTGFSGKLSGTDTDVQLALDTLDDHIHSHTELTDKGTNTHAQIDTHIASTSNPHSVTLGQVGGAAAVHTHTESDITDLNTIEVSNDSGAAMAKGDLCYISGDSSGVPQVTLADADAESTASKKLVLITEAINNGADGTALVRGVLDGFTGLTAGAIQYVSTTAGDFTQTAPSGSGDIVRIAGHAISATEIFFDPDNTFVEVA